MHTIIFHAEVWSEILHLTRTTSSKEKFQKLITTLLARMQGQGCQNTQLLCLLNKFLLTILNFFTD